MRYQRHKMRLPAIALMVVGLAAFSHSASAQQPPFGQQDDVAYAETVWQALIAAKLAGPDAIHVRPYEGAEPHGFVLETLDTTMTINGHTGLMVVKRNYGPEGVEVEAVADNPDEHLAAVTIMFKREVGYDPENKNWFWAKYLPDGTLDKNPKGLRLAGRVAKGNDEAGCIACHKGADGDDYLFIHNRLSD